MISLALALYGMKHKLDTPELFIGTGLIDIIIVDLMI